MSTGSLFFKVRFYLFKEELKVVYRFYRSFRFALVDLAFKLLHLFSNPYRLCRRAKTVYGETPLTTWAQIALLAQIESKDRLVDLGCGRGRLCFWSSLFLGCNSLGIDTVRPFIFRARLLSLLVPKSSFLRARITEAPLEEATVVYLYTFDREEESVRFIKLPVGARVITVSEPLKEDCFSVSCKATVSFPWGVTDVYINKKS